ncbi:hypothetical protein, partial [Komagataeibacter intermedius]|uniref:hypothetical protein n=1 Tax=Komagataeibacter intermedius TaxID=66229 RepID=UPI001A7E6E7C
WLMVLFLFSFLVVSGACRISDLVRSRGSGPQAAGATPRGGSGAEAAHAASRCRPDRRNQVRDPAGAEVMLLDFCFILLFRS